MKLATTKMILVAGLASAIHLQCTAQAHAAGATMKATKSQIPRLADSNAKGNSSDADRTALNQLVPTPDPVSAVPYNTPFPVGNSPVTTVPLNLGTQPSLTPTPRPPLGLYYGEQDHLDALNNPTPRPLTSMYSPGTTPVNQYPPLGSVPSGNVGTPVPLEAGMPVMVTPHYDRFGIAPPPGTLGQTYKRRSRLIEDTKHPRMGAVEVNLPEQVDVTAKGLKPKWTGSVWRLESDSLLPGVPHIYEIKASWNDGTPPQYRTVRLIMGRIVDLDF